MFDARAVEDIPSLSTPIKVEQVSRKILAFRVAKRLFDIFFSVLLIPVLVVLGVLILALNPICNRGPLFFVQTRMGHHCKPFRTIKFRTMRPVSQVDRSADAPLEKDRITRFGGFLRRSRIDELPQIINVLFGHMSLIGPRPDFYDHAVHYLEIIPGYRERHAVRPGISGLAQTELGYAEGVEATRRKVRADLYYITHLGFRLELFIFLRTVTVVARRHGV